MRSIARDRLGGIHRVLRFRIGEQTQQGAGQTLFGSPERGRLDQRDGERAQPSPGALISSGRVLVGRPARGRSTLGPFVPTLQQQTFAL